VLDFPLHIPIILGLNRPLPILIVANKKDIVLKTWLKGKE
jgi:hypothetical protein